MSCPSDKILNPSTGRCVLKSGKMAKQLLKGKVDLYKVITINSIKNIMDKGWPDVRKSIQPIKYIQKITIKLFKKYMNHPTNIRKLLSYLRVGDKSLYKQAKKVIKLNRASYLDKGISNAKLCLNKDQTRKVATIFEYIIAEILDISIKNNKLKLENVVNGIKNDDLRYVL